MFAINQVFFLNHKNPIYLLQTNKRTDLLTLNIEKLRFKKNKDLLYGFVDMVTSNMFSYRLILGENLLTIGACKYTIILGKN